MQKLHKVVFLDRDGVVNRDSPDYIRSWAEFKLLPGSLEALIRLSREGFASIIITNQSAVNRRTMSLEDLELIHRNLRSLVSAGGGRITDIFFCPHRPEERCGCRKPKPGLIRQAQTRYAIDLKRAYVVGDSAKDIECAQKAGCGYAVLVRTGNGLQAEAELAGRNIHSDYIAEDLTDAVDWIISHDRIADIPDHA